MITIEEKEIREVIRKKLLKESKSNLNYYFTLAAFFDSKGKNIHDEGVHPKLKLAKSDNIFLARFFDSREFKELRRVYNKADTVFIARNDSDTGFDNFGCGVTALQSFKARTLRTRPKENQEISIKLEDIKFCTEASFKSFFNSNPNLLPHTKQRRAAGFGRPTAGSSTAITVDSAFNGFIDCFHPVGTSKDGSWRVGYFDLDPEDDRVNENILGCMHINNEKFIIIDPDTAMRSKIFPKLRDSFESSTYGKDFDKAKKGAKESTLDAIIDFFL